MYGYRFIILEHAILLCTRDIPREKVDDVISIARLQRLSLPVDGESVCISYRVVEDERALVFVFVCSHSTSIHISNVSIHITLIICN